MVKTVAAGTTEGDDMTGHLERALAWLTPIADDPEPIFTRMRAARAEITDAIDAAPTPQPVDPAASKDHDLARSEPVDDLVERLRDRICEDGRDGSIFILNKMRMNS